MAANEKYEPVFDLIKGMTKAEKRNFKLYAKRLQGNEEAKFLTLFDCLDSMDEYREEKVLAKCPVRKEQLPNMKAHLYRQLLISIRMLEVQHSQKMQLREQLDFVRILYDKGLYRQSDKLLDKVKEQALASEDFTIAIDAADLKARIDTLSIGREIQVPEGGITDIISICARLQNIAELSDASTRAYILHHKLGYARSQKDLDLIKTYFGPRLAAFADRRQSATERFHFYQASAWYYYIQHDFVRCYRYSKLWIRLFEEIPGLKYAYYDHYIKGWSRILEGLYMMKKYRRFAEDLERFETEHHELSGLNPNADILATRVLLVNRIHKYYIEGDFKTGIELVPEVMNYLDKYSKHLDVRFKMMLHYKVACLYFGNADYKRCMCHLGEITSMRDPEIRRDLQCYARILSLVASYEAGLDYNLDYQVRSVYTFLVKMNDLNAVQKEILSFLKKLSGIYDSDLREELGQLHERLVPLGEHPYERRSFYYLDLLSWLESKITGKTVSEIIKNKFKSEFL